MARAQRVAEQHHVVEVPVLVPDDGVAEPGAAIRRSRCPCSSSANALAVQDRLSPSDMRSRPALSNVAVRPGTCCASGCARSTVLVLPENQQDNSNSRVVPYQASRFGRSSRAGSNRSRWRVLMALSATTIKSASANSATSHRPAEVEADAGNDGAAQPGDRSGPCGGRCYRPGAHAPPGARSSMSSKTT